MTDDNRAEAWASLEQKRHPGVKTSRLRHFSVGPRTSRGAVPPLGRLPAGFGGLFGAEGNGLILRSGGYTYWWFDAPQVDPGQAVAVSLPDTVDLEAATTGRWALIARMAGRVEWDRSALNVVVNKCEITRPESITESQEVVDILAGIARPFKHSFMTQRCSAPRGIGQILQPEGKLELGPLY
jgi:hypothetical protein